MKFFQDLILELLETFKDENYIIEIKSGQDDGGHTIDIICNQALFPLKDPFPRKYKGVNICVLKKPLPIISSEFKA